MASGVRPRTAKCNPFRLTSPYLPSSMRCTNAKVHEPFVGRALRFVVGHGHRKSQLHVSKYSPLTRQFTLSVVFATEPSFDALATHIGDETEVPRSVAASSGSIATARPRTTKPTPTIRATKSPRGRSFSMKTIKAINKTQGRLIAPAATRTTMSAEQQPMQYAA